jgi:hypothetical protein
MAEDDMWSSTCQRGLLSTQTIADFASPILMSANRSRLRYAETRSS